MRTWAFLTVSSLGIASLGAIAYVISGGIVDSGPSDKEVMNNPSEYIGENVSLEGTLQSGALGSYDRIVKDEARIDFRGCSGSIAAQIIDSGIEVERGNPQPLDVSAEGSISTRENPVYSGTYYFGCRSPTLKE